MSVSLQAVSSKTVSPKTFFFVQKKLRKFFRFVLFLFFMKFMMYRNCPAWLEFKDNTLQGEGIPLVVSASG